MFGDKTLQSIADAVRKVMEEELKGKQKVLDKNKNNKIDAEDFKLLRKEEQEVQQEGWDDMLKAAAEKRKPQPNGGAGKKEGTRYGGGKQKDEKENVKEEVEQIEERQMTDAEMAKREDIVKGMKKGLKGFKARYGDRAKNVMYATATKQAMKD